jgi:hypothetical protein
MNEDNNNTRNQPPQQTEIPEFLHGDNWFQEDTAALYLDFTKPYKPPRWTLSHDGVPFAKLGDLHVISGKAGHGKTALMSQFMACLLSGSFGHLKSELKEDAVVLYIDTEQSEDDTIAIKNRVCMLAGIPLDQPNDRFKVVRLRETELAAERWRQILKVIWEVRPTVCFLDGMLDIVEDYNDQKLCQPIIRKCMKLVTHYDMSMWCVLHENPMADKMVGTLGSITQRKVTEVFAVRKHKHEKDKFPNMPDIFFEVIQPKARGRDQDEWCFEVLSAESWGVPVELDDNGRVNDPEERRQREFISEANERFSKLAWTSSGISRSDLDSALIKQGVTSTRRRVDLINIALEKGIIYKTGEKQRPKYHFNGLNKELPNDQAGDLPFDRPDGEPAPY